MQPEDSFMSARSDSSPVKQQPPLVHALSERLSGPNGMLSCLGTPPRTPRPATVDPPLALGGPTTEAVRATPTATPR